MNALEQSVFDFLKALGLPQDEATAQTPARVAQLWQKNLLSGHQRSPSEAFANRIRASHHGLVTLTNIPYYSICPHHLTPSFGYVHLVYEPGDWIVGFGDLEELVSIYSKRLILQEDLAHNIAQAMMDELVVKGVLCQIEGQHFCMILQNHGLQESRVITRCALGSLTQRTDLLPSISLPSRTSSTEHLQAANQGE